MTVQTEFKSWFASPKGPVTNAPPQPGDQAPQTGTLELKPDRPSIIAFLRHCGCPFSEKTFIDLREAAKKHQDIDFIAVSHSDQSATDNWLNAIPKDASQPDNFRIVVDDQKEAYAAWGLGKASLVHVLNPISLYEVIKLSAVGGIGARSTQSGTRWQTSGTYAVARDGKVRWGGPSKRADDVPNFDKALKALQTDEK